MVERNDAKEGDAMGEKRDIKETASLFGRRSALVLGTISATALFGPLGGAALAQGTGGIKLTLLFTPPKDPVASTKYYLETHVPLVSKTPGVKRLTLRRSCRHRPVSPYRLTVGSLKSILMTLVRYRLGSGRRNGKQSLRTSPTLRTPVALLALHR
jgi:hypothetical protein